MGGIRVKSDSRFTPAGLRLLLTSVLALALGAVHSVTVPVLPDEPPALVVPAAHDARCVARDRRSAQAVPHSPEMVALRRWVERGAEREFGLSPANLDLADEAIEVQAAVASAVRRHGRGALDQLRAELALEAQRVLDTRARSRRERLLLGGFESSLEAWGIRMGGRLVTSPLVVRTLFKARVSTILRRPFDEGFGWEERRAYYGWLALHGTRARAGDRIEAAFELARFDRSPVGEEALAFALLAEGSFAAAAGTYERLARRTGSARLRNHARAVHLAAQ